MSVLVQADFGKGPVDIFMHSDDCRVAKKVIRDDSMWIINCPGASPKETIQVFLDDFGPGTSEDMGFRAEDIKYHPCVKKEVAKNA